MKCVLFQHGFPLPASDWGSRRSKAKGCKVQVNKSVEGIIQDKEELCIYCSDKSLSGCLAGTRVPQRSWPGWLSVRQSPRPQGNIQARIKYEIRLPIISLLENILPFLPHRQFSNKVSIIYWLSRLYILFLQIWEVLAPLSLLNLLVPGEWRRVLSPAGHSLGVAHAHAGPRQLQPGHRGGDRQTHRPHSDQSPGQRSQQVNLPLPGKIWLTLEIFLLKSIHS